MKPGQAAQASPSTYALGDALPGEVLPTVPAGTSLLVAGPSMSGKADLLLGMLAAGADERQPAIVVSPDTRADRVVERYGGDRERLWVVDCSGSSGRGSFADSEHVSHLSSPGDLTGIGIGIAKATRAIGPNVRKGLRMGVLSVSTLLQYAGDDRVFNFLHVLTGRVAAGDYLGVFTMDPAAHDEQTVNVITSQFDAIVDVREGDDGREFRVRGLPEVDREWRAL